MTFTLRPVRRKTENASDRGWAAEQERQREREIKARRREAAEEYAPVSRAARCP